MSPSLSPRLISATLLSIVLIYGLFKAIPLIRGPYIVVSDLSTNAEGLTTLTGTSVHTDTLSFDGGVLLIDSEGHFSTSLMFPRGGAILTLTATDRFGRSRTLERTVVTP